MRVAVMIIALCLTMLIGLQSCAATLGGSLIQDEATKSAGAIGILLAFVFVLGAAFVIGFPRFAGVLFLLGGVIAIVAATGSRYGDLGIWGGASIILSLMAFVGSRELTRGRHVAAADWEPSPTRTAQPYDGRPGLLMPGLAVIVVALLIAGGLVGGGIVNLNRFVGNAAMADASAAPGDGVSEDDTVEGIGEVNVPAPAATSAAGSATGPFVDATGRQDAASAADVPQVTKEWLLGEWGPVPTNGDRTNACDNDSTVMFSKTDEYYDGGSHGSFTTDGRSITYHHRVLVDMGENTEDRSQYDRPLISRVEAVDANTMREDGALLLRCSSL